MSLLSFLEVSPKSASIKKIVFIFLLMSFVFNLQAQTSISGVVNTYAPVSNVSGNTVTVGTSRGVTRAWAVGDYVLLVQMTGSTDANAGHYDLRKITSVSGSTLILDGNPLTGRYDPTAEKVQVVYTPYSTNGFTVTGTLIPSVWNGTTGGVVSIYTTGTLTLNADIDASCSGFLGTETQLLTGSNIYYGGGGGTSYATTNNIGAIGGGYGIGGAGGIGTGTSPNGTYNGGATSSGVGCSPGTRGGGGGGAGAGGGGGGGGGGGLTVGGSGGASPSRGGCGGIGRTSTAFGGTGSINGVGGTAGTGLGAAAGGTKFNAGTNTNYENFLNTSNPRVQMGGSSNVPGTTSAGGGIVIVLANTINGGARSIMANGCATASNSIDLRSGGSGAGTVVINALNYNSAVTLSAKGGKGMDGVNYGDGCQHASGGGGGGGGGAIWVSNSVSSNNLNSTLTPPNITNVTFNVDGGLAGDHAVYPKNGDYTTGGGCGGAGIIYASPFSLANLCGGAGTNPPALTTTTINNVCPSVIVNLNTALSSSTPCPSTSSLEWHTVNTNLSADNKISTPTSVNVGGVYYPVCYDATNNCYGPTPATGLTATIACCPGFGQAPTITKNTFTN